MRGNNKGNVVMIADDDLFIRKVIASAVSDFAEIVEVIDGADVVDTYKQHQPDMIFLDIHLPNNNGLDLIRPLQKADAGAFIVMVSADSSTDNVFKIKQRGARAFLTKPFNKDRVMHVFNKCPTIQFMDF